MGCATVQDYNDAQSAEDRLLCAALRQEIEAALPEAEGRIWHAHPVWFLAGNPVVGYSRLKSCIRLLFWSGQSFHAWPFPRGQVQGGREALHLRR
jgi:hypothetical protein